MIIGSTAAKHWLEDSFWRTPKDFDTMEINKPQNGIPKDLIGLWDDVVSYLNKNSTDQKHASLQCLYTLKVSHAAWDVHWDKTMLDIIKYQDLGINVVDEKLFEMVQPLWIALHGKKQVNLNQQNDTFFLKHVKRKYPHDWLHEQVAFYDRPLNEKIRENLNSPKCSQHLFENLCYNDKIKCALEEIIVIAIERYDLTTELTNVDKKRAIHKAYKSLVTTMTVGFFNRFLTENMKPLLYDGEEIWTNQLSQSLQKIQQST